MTASTTTGGKFEFYREQILTALDQGKPVYRAGGWRWLYRTKNDVIVLGGTGGEYDNIRDMFKVLRTHYGDSIKRCRELDKALALLRRSNDIATFEFYTAGK